MHEKPSRRLVAWTVAVMIAFLHLSVAGFVFLLSDQFLLGEAFFALGIILAVLWLLATRHGWFR
jgi:hypothetical protein